MSSRPTPTPIFSVPIYEFDVPDIDMHEQYFAPYINTLEEHRQVRTDFVDNQRYDLPHNLKEFILESVGGIVGRADLKIHTYWLQDYQPNQYHSMHTHGDTLYAGVIYLRFKGHGGHLIFQNPCTVQWMTRSGPFEHYYQPQRGKMVVFDGWLPHRVADVEDTVKERSILAFNVVRDYSSTEGTL